MERLFKYIVLVLILYIYIHNPLFAVLSGVGSIKILYLILGFIIALSWSKYARIVKLFNKELKYCVYIFVFVFLRTIIGGDPSIFRSTITAFVEIFFLPLSIILFVEEYLNKENSKDFLIRFVLIVGCIGSLISTLCIISPSFGSYVKFSLSYLPDTAFLSKVEFRGFGLSEDLVGGYGMIQGAILALGIAYLDKYKWFVFFYPFMFISIMLNARTGIIVALIGLIIYVYRRKRLGSVFVISAVVMLFVFMVGRILSMGFLSDESLAFIMKFFEELNEVQEAGSMEGSDTYEALMGDGFKHPDSLIGMIIGDGYQIMGNKKGVSSDVGYFNQLFYGGLIYCTILYGYILHNVKRLRNKCKNDSIYILFLLMFLIANFKGLYLLNSGGFRLMSLLYFSCVFYSYYVNNSGMVKFLKNNQNS